MGLRRNLYPDAPPYAAADAKSGGQGMIAEFNIYGIFVPALLIFAIIAFLLAFVVRSVLDISGLLSFGLAPSTV